MKFHHSFALSLSLCLSSFKSLHLKRKNRRICVNVWKKKEKKKNTKEETMDRNLDALNSIERASKTEMEERRRERERGCVYTRDDRWPRSPLQDESGHEGDARDACSLARFGRRLIPSRIVWWSTHGLKFSRADDERSVGDSGSKTSGRHKPGRMERERDRERGSIFGFTRVYRWVYYRESVAHLRDVLSFWRDVESRVGESAYTPSS